jgi:hypothetical protein
MKKSIKQAGAADIADQHNLMPGQSHVLKCLIQGVGNALMGAART